MTNLVERQRRVDELTQQVERLEKRHMQDMRDLTSLIDQKRETLVQLRGGDTDPRVDETHPGHILVKLGWGYFFEKEDHHDNLGLHWRDPEEKGTGKLSLMCLSMALAIVYRRLEERLAVPTWMERLVDDENGV